MPEHVFIIGNCQARPIADALKALAPGLKIDALHVGLVKTQAQRDKVFASLDRYDLILSHKMIRKQFGSLSTDKLTEKFPDVVVFPQIAFSGFHPDTIYVSIDKRPLASPAGAYHSLLTVASFLMGLPPSRVPELFNAYVFSLLGYFEEFPVAKAYFLAGASELGFDLGSSFEAWLASGQFMHTVNHPAVRVLSTLASKIAERTGIQSTGTTEGIPDQLAQAVILPVFPVLAERLGIAGSTKFKVSKRPDNSPSDGLDLQEFIDESYRIYAGVSPAALETPRIKQVKKVLGRELV